MSLTPEAVCVVLSRVSRGIEELASYVVTQPFRASYSAFFKYEREGLPEKPDLCSSLYQNCHHKRCHKTIR